MSSNSNDKDRAEEESGSWGPVGDFAWGILKWLAWEAFVIGGTYLVSSMIVRWVKQSNPTLNDTQAERLQSLLNKAVVDYRFNQSQEMETNIMAILLLICPDGVNIDSIFNSLVSDGDINESAANLSDEERAGRQMPSDVEFTTTKVEDDASDVLVSKFHLDHDRVLLIPAELRQALLDLLETNPTCPISLEPAVDPATGHMAPGFTVLFQYLNGVPHAFLFDSESIDGWVQQHNTNPVTRQAAHLKEFFPLT